MTNYITPTQTVKRPFHARRGRGLPQHGAIFKRLSNALRNGCDGPSGARRNAPAASAHPMRFASGGFAPGHVGGRCEPVRRDARQRHFRDRRHGPAVMAVAVRSFSPRAGSIRAAIASDGMSPSFRLYSGPPEHSTRGGFSQRPSSACFARTPSPTGASASVAASGLGDEDKFRRGVYSNGSRTGPLSAKDIPTDDPTFKGLSTLSWTANTRPKPPSSVYSIRTPT